MTGVLDAIGRRLAWVEAVLMAFSGAMLVALLILMNVEVGARYVFARSTMVADEFGGYLFAWIVMLGAIQALRGDRYLSMTALVDMAGPRLRNGVALAGAVIGLAVCIVVLDATIGLVATSYRFGTRSIQPSGIRIFWAQLALPIGYGLLALAFAEEICRRAAGLGPRQMDDGPDIGGLG